MDVTKFIWGNIKIFSVAVLALVLVRIFMELVYASLRSRFRYTKFGEYLTRKNALRTLANIVLPVLLLALLTALQQSYGLIQLGIKDNYIALVISILTLYGILYTFLQFTIGYALQNKNDKYWGRSITKDFFLKRLGFEIFKSITFKLLLLYAVIYPTVSKAILLGIEDFNIPLPDTFPQAFWEVSVFFIYILYAYLFLQSLSSMKILYDIQERRSLGLEWKIEEVVAEEYKRRFKYSYENNRDYFLDKLFEELEPLDQNEQANMLMHVLRETFSLVEFPRNKQGGQYKFFNQGEQAFNYKPFYVHNLFNSLYEKLEKSNIQLSLQQLLEIYGLHDNAINSSMGSSDNYDYEQDEDYFDKLTRVHSNRNDWARNEDCTYFKLPSIIGKCISSCKDIEEVHSHITRRQGFKVISDAYNLNSPECKSSHKMLAISYDKFLRNMLEHYKNYQSDLKHRQHSSFLGLFPTNNWKGYMDERISEVIYDYLIRMEYTEHNKEYAIFLVSKLDFKYKVSLVFYHMLYTGYSWEWKGDVLFLKRVVSGIWVNESVTDEHVLDFVCDKIKNSNIGHRISSGLIKWISRRINITRLNEEVLEGCLLERNISYAQFLKFKYIFSENHYCPMDFYDVDFEKVTSSSYSDWKVGFLKEMLQTPKLLSEDFFARHLLYYCQKISYTTDHFDFENDFRVFFINRFFKFSESQLIDLLYKRYPSRGIIEFLILQLGEPEYEYLTEEIAFKAFSSEVRKIMNIENKSIDSYVKELVIQANECRNGAVSIVKENEIIDILNFLFSQSHHHFPLSRPINNPRL